MSRHNRNYAKKLGKAPGTYVFTGERKIDKVKITLMEYDGQKLEFKTVENVEQTFPYKDKPSVSWINIYGLHETEVMEKIDRHFGIHPLILEDIVNTNQRPKIEIFDGYVFIVLKMLWFDEQKMELTVEQISLIVGPNFLICFQEWEGDIFNHIRERMKVESSRLRTRGADYLCYAILDVIVDHYFLVLEKIGDKIESLEEEVLDDPDQQTMHKINRLKRDLIFLRKSIWPLREVISGIERGEIDLFEDRNMPFIRDLYDHTIQVIDTIESYRDMTAGILDMYMSVISNRMNEVMKVLTIIATIFIPLTFLAGIYGMNFDHMPELHWPWAYPLFWLIMIVVAAIMVVFFRRKQWL
ncbi:MAG: magnesium/cobalt transporter CorA [Calditrichaeota bacterium]|nr:magnesium/cobalt transporter CorA [Calditrichota bacterium]MCB0296459.1 magnesium/cobalt transporter CorA [Calditrichota bacterium]MCB0314894.1 magnesium/cobalt transporter CorA [Calditrichota bacterium]